MNQRAIELSLAACEACGALALYELWREIAHLSSGKRFTSLEVVAHASVPENARLKAAIEACCGEVSARKVGKLLTRFEGASLCGLRIDSVGNERNSIVWAAKVAETRTALADDGSIDALPTGKRYV